MELRTLRQVAARLQATVRQRTRLLNQFHHLLALTFPERARLVKDVALGWVADRVVTSPVALRAEGDRRYGYSWRTLMSHFWRMVLSSGTKGLRLVSVLGVAAAVLGVLLALFLLIARLADAQAWNSVPRYSTFGFTMSSRSTSVVHFGRFARRDFQVAPKSSVTKTYASSSLERWPSNTM